MQTRVSPWFTWHAHQLRPGMRVLDLACGTGRHAIAAALLGAKVTAVDRDAAALHQMRDAAARAGAEVTVLETDLEGDFPAELGRYECVMVFNYLDRARVADLRRLVAPGGVLMMETFLVDQRAQGWGPSHDAHLLQPGELARLAAPWFVEHGREALEEVGGARVRAVASIVARRPIADRTEV